MDTETLVIRESADKPAGRSPSPEITNDHISENIAGNYAQEDSPVYGGDSVSQLQTSNFKLQTRFLAFSGDPSSLGGIFSDGTGKGSARPEIISLPEPAYPVVSRRLGEEGRVILEVKISAQGGVLNAKVTESSSHERLDQAALRALENAAFRPATKYGVPVESEKTVAYMFRLEER